MGVLKCRDFMANGKKSMMIRKLISIWDVYDLIKNTKLKQIFSAIYHLI